MAQIHKITTYILDVNETFSDLDSLFEYIDVVVDDVSFHTYERQTVEFEWDDDLPINRYNCKKEEYEKYFEHENVL